MTTPVLGNQPPSSPSPSPAPGLRPPGGAGLRIHDEPAHPPPFALPGEHFAATLVWLLLGAAGLVHVAPELARGNFLAPRVLAVTHAFTLGVITTAIFGALYQMFPVLLGVGLRSVRVGHAGFWIFTTGLALLLAGFWWWSGGLLGTGWVLLFAGLGCFSWNLLPQRRKARRNRIIGLYVSAGHSMLGIAMFLGAARIGETLGWWTVDRLGMIAAHFHLAALGFATLTAVGVGSRMLPMFLAAGDVATRPLAWIGPVGGAGLVIFSVGAIGHLAPVAAAGAVLLAIAAALHLGLVADYFARRAAKRLDHGMAHVAVAFGGLALTLGAGLGLLLGPGFDPRAWAAYALLAILGFLVPFVIGVYYRILPFLTWLNLFGRRDDGRPVPSVPELSRPGWAWTSLALLTAGILGLAAAVRLGSATGATAGAAVWLAGVVVLLAHHLRMLALR